MNNRICINGVLFEAVNDTPGIDPEMYDVLQDAFKMHVAGFRCHSLRLDNKFTDKSASILTYTDYDDVILKLWVHLTNNRKVEWRINCSIDNPTGSSDVFSTEGVLNSLDSISELIDVACNTTAGITDQFTDALDNNVVVANLLGDNDNVSMNELKRIKTTIKNNIISRIRIVS